MKPTIIGLYAEAGAGKDSVTDVIEDYCKHWEISFGRFSFAEPVYALAAVILGTTPENLAERRPKEIGRWFTITDKQLEDARDVYNSYGLDQWEEFSDIWPIFSEKYLTEYEGVWPNPHEEPEGRMIFISPRRMLQLVGTELGRELIREDVWLRTLLYKINKYSPDLAVVTDVRFPNELNFIADSGDEDIDSYVLEIVRPHNPDRTTIKHKSEQRLDSSKIREIILNDGSLEDLEYKVIAYCDKEFD